MSIDNPENKAFIDKWMAYVKKNNLPGGDKRVTNDPMEATYIGIHMWAQAVEQADTTNVDAVRQAVGYQHFKAPSGFDITMDAKNHHLHKPVVHRRGQGRRSVPRRVEDRRPDPGPGLEPVHPRQREEGRRLDATRGRAATARRRSSARPAPCRRGDRDRRRPRRRPTSLRMPPFLGGRSGAAPRVAASEMPSTRPGGGGRRARSSESVDGAAAALDDPRRSGLDALSWTIVRGAGRRACAHRLRPARGAIATSCEQVHRSTPRAVARCEVGQRDPPRRGRCWRSCSSARPTERLAAAERPARSGAARGARRCTRRSSARRTRACTRRAGAGGCHRSTSTAPTGQRASRAVGRAARRARNDAAPGCSGWRSEQDAGGAGPTRASRRRAAAMDLGRSSARRCVGGSSSTAFSLASVLLFAALGLAITFGLLGVINMAHGEMLMLGAYATYAVQTVVPRRTACVDFYLLAAIPVAFLATARRRRRCSSGRSSGILYGRPLETLLATWGISLLLIQTVRLLFGAQNVAVANPDWLAGGVEIAARPGAALDAASRSSSSSSSCCVGVWFLLQRTRLGLQVRAVTQNRAMAACLGIPTARVDALDVRPRLGHRRPGRRRALAARQRRARAGPELHHRLVHGRRAGRRRAPGRRRSPRRWAWASSTSCSSPARARCWARSSCWSSSSSSSSGARRGCSRSRGASGGLTVRERVLRRRPWSRHARPACSARRSCRRGVGVAASRCSNACSGRLGAAPPGLPGAAVRQVPLLRDRRRWRWIWSGATPASSASATGCSSRWAATGWACT